MKWHADIQSVDNGFVVDYCNGEGKRKVVYEEKEDNTLPPIEHNQEHIVTMLYELLDFFGESGSKHHKKRIKITYDKQ